MKIILTNEEWENTKKWLIDYARICDVISEQNQGTSDGYKARQTSENVNAFISK